MEQEASAAPAIAVQTTLLAQMGQSYQANRALMATLQSEGARLGALDTRSTRDGDAVASSTQDVAYSRHLTRWATRTVMITTFATLFVMIPAALFRMDLVSSTTAYVVAGCGLVVYLAVLVIIIRNVAFRRRDDWDRYYFRASADILSHQQQAVDVSATCGSSKSTTSDDDDKPRPVNTLSVKVWSISTDGLSFAYDDDKGTLLRYMSACEYFTIDKGPAHLTFVEFYEAVWDGKDVIKYGPKRLEFAPNRAHTFDFFGTLKT